MKIKAILKWRYFRWQDINSNMEIDDIKRIYARVFLYLSYKLKFLFNVCTLFFYSLKALWQTSSEPLTRKSNLYIQSNWKIKGNFSTISDHLWCFLTSTLPLKKFCLWKILRMLLFMTCERDIACCTFREGINMIRTQVSKVYSCKAFMLPALFLLSSFSV